MSKCKKVKNHKISKSCKNVKVTVIWKHVFNFWKSEMTVTFNFLKFYDFSTFLHFVTFDIFYTFSEFSKKTI